MSKEALSVEDTLKLVPTEPTNNMKSAASQLFARNPKATPSDFYKVMVATAKEALAEPEQEPVANAYALADKVREALDRQSCPDAFMRTAWEAVVNNYTTPPQPQSEARGLSQSKPLTDEEIMNIAKVSCIGISPHEDTLNFAKVIEAAHGIKE